MKSKRILLSIDTVGQLILLILLGGAVVISILTAGTTSLLIGCVLFILGGWQLLSGLFVGIMRSDGKRFEYLFRSVVYLSFLYSSTYFLSGWDIPPFLGIFLMVLFFLVIPSGIAIWYYKYSQRDLEKIRIEEKNETLNISEMDDILDSEEILRHERS